MTGLEVEGGAPPTSGDAPSAGDAEAAAYEASAPLDPLASELPEWEVRTVGFLLGVLFMLLHVTLGRGGPPDAFIPSDPQRREMASPVAATLNRFLWLRRFAPFGDGLAALAITGEFVISETRRTAEWRAGAQAEPLPDSDLSGIGTLERDEPAPPVRPWRPPVAEP